MRELLRLRLVSDQFPAQFACLPFWACEAAIHTRTDVLKRDVHVIGKGPTRLTSHGTQSRQPEPGLEQPSLG